MPKPTFMQSVLRKPTRSYADPYAPSPWSEPSASSSQYYDPPTSRYTAQRDNGVYLGYKEQRHGSNDAGPSRRGPPSISSDMQVSSRSKFPAPRKAMSSVNLYEDTRVGYEREYTSKNGTGTIKKKKKKQRPQVDNESTISGSVDGSISTLPPPSTRPVKTKKTVKRQVMTPESSEMDYAPPPPLLGSSAGGSSASSSPRTPTSLPLQTIAEQPPLPDRPRAGSSAVQKAIAAGIVPPLSPASSDRSSEQSKERLSLVPERTPELRAPSPLNQTEVQQIGDQPTKAPQPPRPVLQVQTETRPAPIIPPRSAKRLSVDSTASGLTDNATFYTPRSSLNVEEQKQESPIRPASMPVLALPAEEPNSGMPDIPSLRFQPPTPAPAPDPETSPFHLQSGARQSSDYMETPPRPAGQPDIVVKSPTPSPAPQASMGHGEIEDEGHSDAGEVGSDEEEAVQPRLRPNSRTSSFSRPQSIMKSGSRSPSVARSLTQSIGRAPSRAGTSSVFQGDELRPSSRASTTRHTSKNSFDDFVVRRSSAQPSEMSFAPEGSIRSGITGYGKGGWAAAHASRSGSSTPVMYMPAGANDGWAEFQQPIPRKSRFTPLPPSSQPKTFNHIVHGTAVGTDSPSAYSQSSSEEEDNAPKPSRSYRRQDHEDDSQYTGSRGDSGSDGPQASMAVPSDRLYDALRDHQMSLGPAVESYPTHRRGPSSVSSSVPPPQTRDLDTFRRSLTQRRSSATPSMVQGAYPSRPVSPAPSRPSSRMGFEPPSFLNPDTLTVLPEMSPEDSARTYIPTEPSKTPRRAASVFGGRSRGARSEVGDGDDRGSVYDLPARAKSAMGHRDDLSRWEGTSTGEGVLLESHGRDETVKGYSNLLLPTGAFKPTSPIKSASVVDLKILGMPHAAMAAVVLSTLPHKDTPIHLRDQTPPLDFSSHIKPPNKVGHAQVLVQVYATAIDELDIRSLDSKGRNDIGKWVPGRSFVGRCMTVGPDEKDIVRGDIVIGIMELRKSGALAEYIVCDRRRLARAPHPTTLTLEQMALIPIQGVAAARAIRTHLTRGSRALIMGAHQGVPALICQEMSRAGVHVTAVISGGDGAYAQSACMTNGARGVLTGSPAGIMLGLDEEGWDFVLDIHGGQRVYDAAKRILKRDATLVTLLDPALNPISTAPVHSRSSGFKTLKNIFSSRKKETKSIAFEYIPPTASGEPAVDASGLDVRDVLEEGCMQSFRPVIEGTEDVVPLEKGREVFKRKDGGVVRIVN